MHPRRLPVAGVGTAVSPRALVLAGEVPRGWVQASSLLPEEVGCVTESRAASCPGGRRWPVNSKTRRSACTGCTSFVPGGLGHQQRQCPDAVTERGLRPRTALCPQMTLPFDE